VQLGWELQAEAEDTVPDTLLSPGGAGRAGHPRGPRERDAPSI